MLRKIAIKVVGRWIDKGFIDLELRECYEFGIEIILLSVMSIIEIAILGWGLKLLSSAIAFLLTFISLRRYTGGYHANTWVKCHLYLIIAYILNIIIVYILRPNIYIVFVAVQLIGISVIVLFGPIESSGKETDIIIIRRNKRNALISFICLDVFSLTLYSKLPEISLVIYIAVLEVIILVVAKKL